MILRTVIVHNYTYTVHMHCHQVLALNCIRGRSVSTIFLRIPFFCVGKQAADLSRLNFFKSNLFLKNQIAFFNRNLIVKIGPAKCAETAILILIAIGICPLLLVSGLMKINCVNKTNKNRLPWHTGPRTARDKVKVKCAIPHEECRPAAHLHSTGREPVASATPDLRFPSQPQSITAP